MNVERPEDASLDDCEQVLERVYEFLDNEVDEATGDAIRHHLAMCEPCLERFDVEARVNHHRKRDLCCRPRLLRDGLV